MDGGVEVTFHDLLLRGKPGEIAKEGPWFCNGKIVERFVRLYQEGGQGASDDSNEQNGRS